MYEKPDLDTPLADLRTNIPPAQTSAFGPIRRAKDVLDAVMQTAGEGPHLVTFTAAVWDGLPMATEVPVINRGSLTALDADALFAAVAVLAGAVCGPRGGAVVLRTVTSPTTATIRIWALRDGKPQPRTAHETRMACCTNPANGEPLPPEPGVTYADAPHLDL